MTTSLDRIPEADAPLFANLPAYLQREVNAILDTVPWINSQPSLRRACKEAAAWLGLTARALYDRVRRYLRSGDWRALVDRAKAGPLFYVEAMPAALPVCTREFVKGIFERFQRNNGAGLREIELILRTHTDSQGRVYEKIPGCEEWPVLNVTPGWSRRNLRRMGPDKRDGAAARIGLFAASAFRPPVFRTRVGMKVLHRVEFDDHEFNLKVHFPGQSKAMRPRGFAACEALSTWLQPSFKPTLWDAEDEVKKTLTERDFMWFVIHWLTEIGYRTDAVGTWLVVEHGTAAIREAFQERIFRATNGQVKIARSGMFDTPAHGGQMGGKGKGNFKGKPLVEGAFNLVDNYFSGLKGQVGLDRLTAPEELGAREQYFGRLLKEAEKSAALCRDAATPHLILPFLTWKEFADAALGLFAGINGTPHHEIEGWGECGFHASEFRLPMGPEAFTPWQNRDAMDAMDANGRAAVLALVNTREDLTRARNLSRAEAFNREIGRARELGEVVKVTPWRFCDLMGLENAYPRPVTVGERHLITLEDRDYTRGKLRYLAVVNGRHLAAGESYRIFANPWAPRVALLTHDDGSAVGLIEQWEAVEMSDMDAQKKMAGKQAHWEAERNQEMERRHGVEAAELSHMKEHNAAVLAGRAPAAAVIAEAAAREHAEELLEKLHGEQRSASE